MRRTIDTREFLLSTVAALMAGAAPGLFVIAQAGYAKMSDLGIYVLVPMVLVLIAIPVLTRTSYPVLSRNMMYGALAGLLAALGLEVVRETGFHFGFMPGDLPKLMGVLLLDRFLEGPSVLSNIAGWGYHFLNGACLGVVLALVLGRVRWWVAVLYAQVISVGFMVSPAVTALGIGMFGMDFGPGFVLTVTVAHLAFGVVLGLLQGKWLRDVGIAARFVSQPAVTDDGSGQQGERKVILMFGRPE